MFRVDNVTVQTERYPDGAPRINVAAVNDNATIEWLYEKDEEMLLFFIARHLREQYSVKDLTLYMPYIPHARMDRVKDKKEVFTLKYFCEFINSIKFDTVIVRDAHSNVSMSLLNNVVSEPIDGTVRKLAKRLLDPRKDIVFCPDEGSRNRYSGIVDIPYAFGIKRRDWNTGRITGLDVCGDIPADPFNVLMIDDISSYGNTFLHSARKLRELGADKIYLYVTHCENSVLEGELIKSGLISKMYTTRSIYNGDHPLIEIIGENCE
ncbi:MAG: hypothetical protein LBE48_04085 [Methanomassiliicoccaceae archaeon]|jgi:ribose-phosphate pyrophosphokinase|nr:hypothetical protein [Methanomassiliicoccaceae archaeon]